MAETKKEKVFSINIDAVWEALTDYENYAKYLAGCKSVTVESRKKNEAVCTFHVKVVKNIKYTLKMQETPKKKISWNMIEGEIIKSNKGSWTLTEVEDGTLVKYQIEVGFPILVPGSVVNTMISASLPKMLDNFEKRAKEIAKAGSKSGVKSGKKAA